MLTVTKKGEKVDVFISPSEDTEEFCLNQFIIRFQVEDLYRIDNSIKDLETVLEQVYTIVGIVLEVRTIAFYCEPNGLTTFSSLVELESAVLHQVREIRGELLDVYVPFEIQLIVDGVY